MSNENFLQVLSYAKQLQTRYNLMFLEALKRARNEFEQEQENERLDELLEENQKNYIFNGVVDYGYDWECVEVLIPAICSLEKFKERLKETSNYFLEPVFQYVGYDNHYLNEATLNIQESKNKKYFELFYTYGVREVA